MHQRGAYEIPSHIIAISTRPPPSEVRGRFQYRPPKPEASPGDGSITVRTAAHKHSSSAGSKVAPGATETAVDGNGTVPTKTGAPDLKPKFGPDPAGLAHHPQFTPDFRAQSDSCVRPDWVPDSVISAEESNTGSPCTSGRELQLKLIGTFPHAATTGLGGPPESPAPNSTIRAMLITADATSGRACLIRVQTGDGASQPLSGGVSLSLG